MSGPHEVTRQFESELCKYTGARYAVAVNSCSSAIFLCLKWFISNLETGGIWVRYVDIPKRTYVSVPMQIVHAGYKVSFRNERWRGAYQLRPFPIWDCARRFTGGMYRKGQFQNVSFHSSKILGIEQGGAILHDNKEADAWFRRARFDGRAEGVAPKNDTFDDLGWHLYMNPSTAAQGLLKLHSLPKKNADLKNSDYPDLSTSRAFR